VGMQPCRMPQQPHAQGCESVELHESFLGIVCGIVLEAC